MTLSVLLAEKVQLFVPRNCAKTAGNFIRAHPDKPHLPIQFALHLLLRLPLA
jgi:hypothetical protein